MKFICQADSPVAGSRIADKLILENGIGHYHQCAFQFDWTAGAIFHFDADILVLS